MSCCDICNSYYEDQSEYMCECDEFGDWQMIFTKLRLAEAKLKQLEDHDYAFTCNGWEALTYMKEVPLNYYSNYTIRIYKEKE